MNLLEKDVLAFASSSLNTFNLSGLGIDKEKATRFLAREIKEEFDELNLEETKAARLDHFKIPGIILEDYEERVFTLGDGRKAICGIRHEGGNKEYPFVQITPNFYIDVKTCRNLYESFLKETFNKFSPNYLRFWSSEHHQEYLTGAVYLVTSMSDVKKRPLADDENRLSFKNIADDSYYDWYENSYKAFHSSSPDLKDRVTVNSKSTMHESLEEGLLKEVYFENKRIGLIAGLRSEFLGNDGIYFNDILIDEAFRGRGLAKSVQKKFLRTFAGEKDFVWGTIDFQNKSSYKTALSNGRKPVRFETFVPI